MNHELDKHGEWEDILNRLAKIGSDVIARTAEIAPCQWTTEHKSEDHLDCQVFEWLGYSTTNQPSIEEYARISNLIQTYLKRFEPSKIDWNLIKELVADGKN